MRLSSQWNPLLRLVTRVRTSLNDGSTQVLNDGSTEVFGSLMERHLAEPTRFYDAY